MSPHRTRRIPEATVARLPVYLQLLVEQAELGIDSISSERLAELGGVNAAKVRKDLSYLGSYGTRGVGYEVAYLVYQIRRELGLTHDWPVVIVGAGNLGQALAGIGESELLDRHTVNSLVLESDCQKARARSTVSRTRSRSGRNSSSSRLGG